MIDNNYKYINNIGFKIYFSGMTLFTVAFIEDGIFYYAMELREVELWLINDGCWSDFGDNIGSIRISNSMHTSK